MPRDFVNEYQTAQRRSKMKSVLCITLLIASVVASPLSQSANDAATHDADFRLVSAAPNATRIAAAPSSGELPVTFRPPGTGIDLLQNLKLALDRDVILDLGFYDEANLLNFFNQSHVKWQTPKSPERMLADIGGDSKSFPGLTVSVERTSYFEDFATADGSTARQRVNVHLHLDINARELRIGADTMKSVFGGGGQVSNSTTQDWQRRTGTPAELTSVQYGTHDPRKAGVGRKYVIFRLYENGNVRDIDIVDEKIY
jgi:hypothetical protein